MYNNPTPNRGLNERVYWWREKLMVEVGQNCGKKLIKKITCGNSVPQVILKVFLIYNGFQSFFLELLFF